MKNVLRHLFTSLLCLFFILIGCKPKPAEKSGHGHDHGAESGGATYQEGKGITLMEETKKSLGLEFTAVGENSFQPKISLKAQIYRLAAEASRAYGRERQGNSYATTLVPQEIAQQLKAGQKLDFSHSRDKSSIHEGTVWKILTPQGPPASKVELLLELPDASHQLTLSDFVEVDIRLGNKPAMLLSVPRSAVLETSVGSFAYVENGGFLLRTEIKTGSQNESLMEVKEGLYDGDTVVVKPVEALYMIELRAVKGGGHCH